MLLACFGTHEMQPDFASQPSPACVAEVARTRPAAQQVVAALPQILLPTHRASAQARTMCVSRAHDAGVQLLGLLRALIGEQHGVPAVDLGLLEQHAELVVAVMLVAIDGLRSS